jgi:Tol biopolymer transport system component
MRTTMRGRAAWVLTTVTLGIVFTMIVIGVVRLGSGGDIDLSPPSPTSSASERPADDGSDARVLDLRTGEVSRLPRSIARIAFDCCFSVSPDGGRIAFIGMVGTSHDRWPGRHGIVVSDVDGSGLRVVARDALGASRDRPQWSPDGTEIVFERESDGALAVVDVATRVVTPITDGDRGEYTQPTFSPDGRTVLFTRDRDQPPALWTVPATGGRESLLIAPGAYGTYSPDGATIAYTWVGTDRYEGIWLAGADGNHRRRASNVFPGTLMGFLVGMQERSRAAWSPDGTSIVASLVDGRPVVVADLGTGETREVAGGGQPVWLDDQTLIIDNYRPLTVG